MKRMLDITSRDPREERATIESVQIKNTGGPVILYRPLVTFLAPLLLSGVTFMAGVCVAGGRPKWLYALGIASIAWISFCWGMVEHAQRFASRVLCAQTLTVKFEHVQEIDHLDIECIGLVRVDKLGAGLIERSGE